MSEWQMQNTFSFLFLSQCTLDKHVQFLGDEKACPTGPNPMAIPSNRNARGLERGSTSAELSADTHRAGLVADVR